MASTAAPREFASKHPPAIISLAPAKPSSAGWNINRTSPKSEKIFHITRTNVDKVNFAKPVRLFLFSTMTFAAVSNDAMCPSCPHACIAPILVLLYSTSAISVMGRASISARRATQRPGLLPYENKNDLKQRADTFQQAQCNCPSPTAYHQQFLPLPQQF